MKNKFGIIGTALGVLALTCAFLSPWLIDTLAPPKPAEEEVIDFASRLKDAAMAKAKGEKYVPVNQPKKDIGDFIPPGVIGLGMLSMTLGIVSLISGEKKLAAGSAVFLGISAAVVQWSLILAGVLIFLLLVAIVLNAAGIDLDF